MATHTQQGSPQLPPQSSYQQFLARLHQPEALELLRSMKLFVRSALSVSTLSVDELAEATCAFYQQTEATIAAHPLWAGCEPLELERAADGVEKFVMSKLHDRVFGADDAERAEDVRLTAWLQQLRFLRVEHFAIAPEYCAAAPWKSAQQELARIASYRTPRDKLVCILNCCKRINSALSHTSAGGHGADELFPVLLFVTLHAAPAGFLASLRYISRFRHPSKLVSEAAYYLTHMESALSFLTNVQPGQLSIDAAEYERGLAQTAIEIARERAEAAAAADAAAAAAAAASDAMGSAGEAVAEAVSVSEVSDGGGGGSENGINSGSGGTPHAVGVTPPSAAPSTAPSTAHALPSGLGQGERAVATPEHPSAAPRGMGLLTRLMQAAPSPSMLLSHGSEAAAALLEQPTAPPPAATEPVAPPPSTETPIRAPRTESRTEVRAEAGAEVHAEAGFEARAEFAPPVTGSAAAQVSGTSIGTAQAARIGAKVGVMLSVDSDAGFGGAQSAGADGAADSGSCEDDSGVGVRGQATDDCNSGGGIDDADGQAASSAPAAACVVSVRVELVIGSAAAVRRQQVLRELGPPPQMHFQETRSVVELTMGDVAKLLAEYQWLSHAVRPA